ncbi:MAG TPA: nucleoside recognition domain-containing protein [Bacilli bacterium]|nr:nucleoside recognition domain-containing protein [Bacilli bacterium]HQD92319.1 nucleoside recognition domain-containing protein [Bacilli bacterium]
MKVLEASKVGLIKAGKTIWKLIKIVVPVYFFVKVLEYVQILPYISNLFSPLMKYFGLPGEAAIVIITGNLLNLYGGIAAMQAFSFTARQITIIAVMLLLSHSLPVETTIIKNLKVPRILQICIRVVTMIIFALILNLVWK